jgi:predicted nucleotidyltransferase/DNA-binding XRE family transcriptional regulator
MDTYKIKFTRVQNEIFRLFCIKAGTTLNQRTVAKMIGISPTTVANALPLLEKEGMVKLEKGNNINLNSVSLNRDSEKAIFFKKIENLKMLYESGVIQFLYNKFPGSTIILFGSYARGEDIVQSDIDIAIISSKDKEVNLKEFDKKLERAVNLNFYVSLKNIEKHLKNNLLNGIVLSGCIEL